MKIIETSRYFNKSRLAGYPLFLYMYSIVDLTNSPFENSYSDFYENTIDRSNWIQSVLTQTDTYYPNLSELRPTRTLINNGSCKVSISLPNQLLLKNVYLILLYAIDLIKYPDHNILNGEYRVSDSISYAINYDNLSVILCNPIHLLTDNKFINKTTNIIDLKHLPNCEVTTYYDENYSIHDSHFMSSLLDRHTYSYIKHSIDSDDIKSAKFIESYSGNEVVRSKLGDSSRGGLKGSMTIKTNRVIEL